MKRTRFPQSTGLPALARLSAFPLVSVVRAFPTVLVLALPLVAGCQPHHTEIAPSSSSSAQSEADRTRELEAKKAELDKREESIKNMVGSDQEKIDAANQLQRDRDALAREADGGH